MGTGQLGPAVRSGSLMLTRRQLVAAVTVVSGAGSFGGDHGGPKGPLRSAAVGESRTVVGLLDSLQHQPADAFRVLFFGHLRHAKSGLGIIARIFFPQGEAAVRNLSHAPPLSRNHPEDLANEILRRTILHRMLRGDMEI